MEKSNVNHACEFIVEAELFKRDFQVGLTLSFVLSVLRNYFL